jgi:hypothetical protein
MSNGRNKYQSREHKQRVRRSSFETRASAAQQRRLRERAPQDEVFETLRPSPMMPKQANLHKTGFDFDLAPAQEFGNTFASLGRSS